MLIFITSDDVPLRPADLNTKYPYLVSLYLSERERRGPQPIKHLAVKGEVVEAVCQGEACPWCESAMVQPRKRWA